MIQAPLLQGSLRNRRVKDNQRVRRGFFCSADLIDSMSRDGLKERSVNPNRHVDSVLLTSGGKNRFASLPANERNDVNWTYAMREISGR
jgi:hypothetical protein